VCILTTNNPPSGIVIAIDGPAGAGKSTVAKQLAGRLGFAFLDTGAMYRCVTLAILRSQVDPADEQAVASLAEQLEIMIGDERVTLNGEDVSKEIRTPEVAGAISRVADNIAVRKLLTQLQRTWTQGKQVVTEGRDQGTEVFYDSPCKFYLYASSEERARRRQIELDSRGIEMTFEEVLQQQNRRDAADQARPVGALRKAKDAHEFCTDGLSLESVVEQVESICREKLAASGIALSSGRSPTTNSDGADHG